MERIPCTNMETCRLRDSKLGCRTDTHHLFYPANQYKKGIAKVFRELEENKVISCRAIHEDIHHTQPIPEFPSVETMQEAINRSRESRKDAA